MVADMNKIGTSDRIDAKRRLAGAELLRTIDAIGFNASTAAWMRNTPTERWFYVLATTMIDTQGPLWIYDRLMKVFGKIQLPEGITPLDIHIVSPDEDFIRNMPVSVDSGINEMYDTKWDGKIMPDMVVYRLVQHRLGASDTATQFNEHVNRLLAA